VILDGSIQKKIRRENFLKLLVVSSILISGLVIILVVPGMLSSFLLAFVISYLFKPIVVFLERKGVRRILAILLPFLVSGLIISAASQFFVTLITDQAVSFQTDLPKYINGLSETIKKPTNTLNLALLPYTKIDLAERMSIWMQNSAGNVLHKIPEWISKFLSTLILAPFFAFFMLKDGQTISRNLLSYMPNNLFEVALNLSSQINKQLGSFIRARLLESVIVGSVVLLGLSSIGTPYASILALFAALTNLIPYIGPVIGAVPGIVIAFVNHDTFASVALISTVYLIAQLIDMLFVIPLVVAKIVDLHPVTVVIVIIIGSQVMGILGMIISVPVASILKLVFTEFYNHVVDIRS
jgi:putative permease